jgi:DNA-binding HxlR family transcriptional regulator
MKDGYGQFCPIASACEVFAKRWTPLVLRELFAGSQRFNEIHRCMPLMSRALLAQRLKELESAGIVSSTPSTRSSKGGPGLEYHLTPAGLEFRAALDALGTWGQRWSLRVQPDKLDAGLLMWNIRRRVDKARLPARRVVVEFVYRGLPTTYRGARHFWLVLEPSAVDVCLHDPGYDVDLCVDADTAALTRVWLGDVTFADALRAKTIRVTGDRPLARQFPSWLLLSPFAGVPRSTSSRPTVAAAA